MCTTACRARERVQRLEGDASRAEQQAVAAHTLLQRARAALDAVQETRRLTQEAPRALNAACAHAREAAAAGRRAVEAQAALVQARTELPTAADASSLHYQQRPKFGLTTGQAMLQQRQAHALQQCAALRAAAGEAHAQRVRAEGHLGACAGEARTFSEVARHAAEAVRLYCQASESARGSLDSAEQGHKAHSQLEFLEKELAATQQAGDAVAHGQGGGVTEGLHPAQAVSLLSAAAARLQRDLAQAAAAAAAAAGNTTTTYLITSEAI